jgi:FkbM family methyltransferase
MLGELLRRAGRVPGVSHLLRAWAEMYREGSVTTIRTGLARGMRWRRHHRYVNGYWIGHYELDLQAVLARELRPGAVFFDAGANAGFFSLAALALVGPAGRCVSIDPDPDNCASIREQQELNRLGNWTVVPAAVADAPGRRVFSRVRPGHVGGHLRELRDFELATEDFEVEAVTLDALAERHGPPDFLKIDVEGAEIAALRGAAGLLSGRRPTWLIELHGGDRARQAAALLAEAGYDVSDIDGRPAAFAADGVFQAVARPR